MPRSVVLRSVGLICFLALACSTARAASWSGLWLTPEQRAQRLLDTGHPKEAAGLFSDPRRRAYAQLRAGQYAAAARELAPYEDAESQYNRGNALARGGDLQGAIAAYDAALKLAPGEADAARNREIVEKELRRRKQNQQAAGQPGGSGSRQRGPGQQSGSSGQQSGASGQQSGPSGQQSGASGQQSGASGQQSAASAQQSASSQRSAPGQQARSPGQQAPAWGKQASASRPQASATNQHPGTAGQQPTPADQRAATSGQQAGRLAQPAGAAGQLSASDQQSSTQQSPGAPEPVTVPKSPTASNQLRGTSEQRFGSAGPASAAAAAPAPRPTATPESEQSLAMDQWLRRIPEDSGELLRRKFLIEHMLKQQDSQQRDARP